MSAVYVGSAWSCTVRLVVDEPRVLRPATEDLLALLDRIDRAASWFRPDSALSIANRAAGRPVPVPRVLIDLLEAAVDAAEQTAGAVDPTVGVAMRRIGYPARGFAAQTALGESAETGGQRDIGSGIPRGADVPAAMDRPGSWRSLRLHREAGLLTVPAGTAVDLGATAKAWTADHAAHTLAARYDTAVLVELGGDLAVAGDRPDGWCIEVAEREGGAGQLVLVRHGGLTTSTTTVRSWQRAGHAMHHIVDPATGLPAVGRWRTASVAASSALAANIASTRSIVRGADAVDWLTRRGLAARLVAQDGSITTTPGWPELLPAVPTVAAQC